MARDTIRVLLQMTLGSPFQQTSDDVKKKSLEEWHKVRDGWKNDPGIEYVSYHSGGATGAGRYAHNFLFAVSDAQKGAEMAEQFYASLPPHDAFGWEIVWGDTETDEFWKS